MTSIGTVEDYIQLGLVQPSHTLDKFKSHIEYVDGHWLWTSHKNADGYARFRETEFGINKLWVAHVWAYVRLIGTYDDSLELGHIVECTYRHCVNPEHVRPVTHMQNMRDGTDPRHDTHCPNGHEWLINNNLHIRKNGQRSCRTCNRDRSREYARAKAREKRVVADR